MTTQQRSIRLSPNPQKPLDDRTGVRGELFYDDAKHTLRIYDGVKKGGYSLLLDNLANLQDGALPPNVIENAHVTLGDTVVQLGGRTTNLVGLDQVQAFSFIGTTNGQHYGDVVGNVTGNLTNGALSNIDVLGFKSGAVVTEFSTDETFADASTTTVPVEAAIIGYVNRRLGVDDTGVLIPPVGQIGPGFLPLDGGNVMTGDINLGSNDITNVGSIGATDLTVTNTITGSVSGNAGTATNGVVTTGSYANPSWITSLALSKVGFTASNSFTFNASGTTALSIRKSSTVLDFGSAPVSSKSFVFADATALATNAVIITPLGNDEWEMDPISYSAQAYDGIVQIFASTSQGPVKGPRSVYYTLV